MRTIKIPINNSSSAVRIQKIREDSLNALEQFCRDRLTASGLVSKTFTYQFRFNSSVFNTRNERSEVKKSLVKLKELFRRALDKQIPYVEHSRDPFFTISNRNTFIIKLISWAEKSNVNVVALRSFGNRAREEYITGTNFGRSISRYVRYLQFLCLKYGVPFQIDASYTFKYSDESATEIERLETESSAAGYMPEIHYLVGIKVNIVYSSIRDHGPLLLPEGVRRNLRDVGQRAYVDAMVMTRGESFTYRPENWVFHSVASGQPVSSVNDITGREKHWTIEKLFLYLEQIQTVLRTLSRKTSYVPAAFSIRASENSGSE